MGRIKCFDCGREIEVVETYKLTNGNKLYIALCEKCNVRTSTTFLEGDKDGK